MNDAQAIALALEEAKSAAKRGEVPVGAVLVSDKGEVLAYNGNRTEELCDPTAHAEMLVIRDAGIISAPAEAAEKRVAALTARIRTEDMVEVWKKFIVEELRRL